MPDERPKTYGEMVWIEAMREAAGLVCCWCAEGDEFKDGKHVTEDGEGKPFTYPCRAKKIHERLALKEKE